MRVAVEVDEDVDVGVDERGVEMTTLGGSVVFGCGMVASSGFWPWFPM